MSVAIVDSGVANLTSVLAALERLGAEARVTDNPDELRRASRVILPGVGAASAAMRALEAKGLADAIRALRCPVLGICLGMQLLFKKSEEGDAACLGVIDAGVRKLRVSAGEPLPHMGWNRLGWKAENPHPLLRGVEAGAFVYYVHGYAAPLGAYTAAQTTYGEPFTAIASQDNFMGCQFHPERSGAAGSLILKNFLEL